MYKIIINKFTISNNIYDNVSITRYDYKDDNIDKNRYNSINSHVDIAIDANIDKNYQEIFKCQNF